MKHGHRVLALLLMASLAGCATFARETPYPDMAPLSAQSGAAPAANGSIYQDGQGVALFEDQKARRIGDVLTVLLVETTTAKTSSATSTNKTTDGSITTPTIMGHSGWSVGGFPIFNNSLGSEHSFSGGGDSTQSNTLQGNIGAVVVRRFANGNLLIRGEKNMKLNQGDETVLVEGIVRPQDIAPDNTIASSRIANARISYSGRGALGESNAKGWLARFFSSEWMPF